MSKIVFTLSQCFHEDKIEFYAFFSEASLELKEVLSNRGLGTMWEGIKPLKLK
jgi:hypothetical protein